MIGTDLTWHDTRRGYVNCCGGVPERLNGRLHYRPLQTDLRGREELRYARWRRFEACWPVCAYPRACSLGDTCTRELARSAVVWRARMALYALV